MSEVLLIENAWGLARLTLNRPESRNALTPALVRALIDAFEALAKDESVRVIELTGAGDKAFCAGGDFSGGAFGGDGGALTAHYNRAGFADLLRAIRDVGKPVVAVVQGHALGGGFGLAMACDLVVAAEDATFGTPEINVGLFPMIIMPILARNIPRKKLLEMFFTGARVPAPEALQWGFVNAVVPRAQLREKADETLQQLLSKSSAVLRLGREAFYRMSEMALDPALDHMVAQLSLNLMTEDAMEGLSAFMQKRPPEWKGR